MPFIYRGEIANINRCNKRDNNFIHENVIKALEIICEKSVSHSHYIRIMPTEFREPPFNNADPNKFLTVYTTKILGLSLYEVEHWLDNIAENHGIYTNRTPRTYIDERRKYYKQPSKAGFGIGRSVNPKTCGGFISTYIIYRSLK